RGSVRRCSRPPSSPIVLPLSRHEKSFRPPWEEARLAPTLISQERILQELAPHGRSGPPVAGFHRACPSTTLDKSGNTTLCNCCAFGSHAITAPRGCQCCLSRISPAPGAGAAPVKGRWNAGGAPRRGRRARAAVRARAQTRRARAQTMRARAKTLRARSKALRARPNTRAAPARGPRGPAAGRLAGGAVGCDVRKIAREPLFPKGIATSDPRRADTPQ